MGRRNATLDAKQRSLAKKLIEFRQKLLHETENRKPNKQTLNSMRSMDNALSILRNVANQLRRNDNSLFNSVIDVIKALQGDLSNKR